MGLLSLFNNGNFGTYNRQLAKKIGLNEAILVSDLASKYDYWKEKHKLNDNYFYATAKMIQDSTTLSARQQKPAFDHLEEYGLLETKLCGLPSKKYFRLNEKKLKELIEDD